MLAALADLGLDREVDVVLGRLLAGAERAARTYEVTHWGDSPTELVPSVVPLVRSGEALPVLGELVEVVYRARKAREMADWIHAFSVPRPLLALSADRRLVIAGGRYKVNERGIVG
jgi:hypothetical protein